MGIVEIPCASRDGALARRPVEWKLGDVNYFLILFLRLVERAVVSTRGIRVIQKPRQNSLATGEIVSTAFGDFRAWAPPTQ